MSISLSKVEQLQKQLAQSKGKGKGVEPQQPATPCFSTELKATKATKVKRTRLQVRITQLVFSSDKGRPPGK